MLPNFSWLDNVVTKLVTPICEPKENDYCICISKRINLKYAYEQFKKNCLNQHSALLILLFWFANTIGEPER